LSSSKWLKALEIKEERLAGRKKKKCEQEGITETK